MRRLHQKWPIKSTQLSTKIRPIGPIKVRQRATYTSTSFFCSWPAQMSWECPSLIIAIRTPILTREAFDMKISRHIAYASLESECEGLKAMLVGRRQWRGVELWSSTSKVWDDNRRWWGWNFLATWMWQKRPKHRLGAQQLRSWYFSSVQHQKDAWLTWLWCFHPNLLVTHAPYPWSHRPWAQSRPESRWKWFEPIDHAIQSD